MSNEHENQNKRLVHKVAQLHAEILSLDLDKGALERKLDSANMVAADSKLQNERLVTRIVELEIILSETLTMLHISHHKGDVKECTAVPCRNTLKVLRAEIPEPSWIQKKAEQEDGCFVSAGADDDRCPYCGSFRGHPHEPDCSPGFFDHIVDCEDCWTDRDIGKLCAIGEELLFEEDDLPAHWQKFARRIRDRQVREREAEANFEYYKGVDEP